MASIGVKGVAAPMMAALALVFAPAAGLAQEHSDSHAEDGELLFSAEDMAVMLEQPANGVISQTMFEGAAHRLSLVERDAPGVPEVHERWSDIFIVQTGEADVTLGGEVDGATMTAPTEWRGGTISGGHVRHIGPGDVLWIPAGTPHLTVPTSDTPFRYLTVKIGLAEPVEGETQP